jgi:hypothetical protein
MLSLVLSKTGAGWTAACGQESLGVVSEPLADVVGEISHVVHNYPFVNISGGI